MADSKSSNFSTRRDSATSSLESSTTKLASTNSENKVKRKRSRCKRGSTKFSLDDDLELEEKIKSKFLSKVDKGKNSGKTTDELQEPVIRKEVEKKSRVNMFKIVDPDAYSRVLNRIEESQANKVQRPDGEIIDGPYQCAMCLKGPDPMSLGDLFGPSYLRLTPEFWPPFLNMPKDKRRPDLFIDIWIHGFCALWTSGILAKGNTFTGLEESLTEYWQHKCSICQNVGASIGCSVKSCKKAYHYRCAVKFGCVLKEDSFALFCQIHKKLAG